MSDKDFILKLNGYSLVTVKVLYWMPDYRHLVQEFTWQTLDVKPKYPRVEAFLDYWQQEIHATIKEVQLSDSTGLMPGRFMKVDQYFTLR